ncbi:MAG: acyl-CoA synthetase [Gaiellaceae bacterium]|jgi:fatty-acyl-CoA synthase
MNAHTIDHWIRNTARRTPNRVAIDYLDREVTYQELDVRSDALAGELLARGLRRGDRVATLTGNTPEHVIVFFACAKAGLILLPLNWRLAAPELRFQLEDSEPSVFLVEPEYESLAAATGHAFEPLAPPNDRATLVTTDVDADDPLLLIYTSGTTGRPKGALLTHANCFWTNLSFDLATGLTGDDVVLQVLPQFHCGGWNVQPLLSWWKGGRVVLERTFEPARVLALLAEKRVTTLMGVPAVYLFLSHEPAFADADLSSLRLAVVGGAPMPEELIRVWQARGVEIVQGYGLTEAAPNVLCLPPEDAMRKMGSAGKPYPYVEVRLGDESELQVRGPNVFPGYWRNSEATAAVLRDGWLHTGDVAEVDDEGCYRIRGRLKDMYISGGENVYPAEVESVLHEHASVADAAVVGVTDERWGEVGVAFVAAKEPVSDEALVEHCRDRLARYKVPKRIVFVDALPMSAMNKVLKDELRALVEHEEVTA